MKASNKKILSKYEQNLRTAYYSDYSRNMPRIAIEEIEKVVYDELGTSQTLNYNCSYCILKLLKQAGKIYFESNE